MGLTKMTEIQHKTLDAVGALSSDMSTLHRASTTKVDILGRARTGTGKTVAFLLPALHHLDTVLQAGQGSKNMNPKMNKEVISVLIISPTRELATQIANEARALTKHRQQSNYSVQCVFGGTSINTDVRKFKERVPTILVATPGRLKAHLEETTVPGRGRFSQMIQNGIRVSILDEADRLLDMGFRKDIMDILSYLPPKEARQTFLFSATLPTGMKDFMGKAMKANYTTVDCINDGSAETSLQVKQSHVILPPSTTGTGGPNRMDRSVVGVVEVVLKAMQDDPSCKIICFFPVARMVGYFEDLFHAMGMTQTVWGIHSRKSQSKRTKVSEDFRRASKGILLSSDVSARGVDYPGVTHVIQFGLPDTKEQYIHRLGRTGRGGQTGQGWLVLSPFEASFVKNDLGGVDCPVNSELKELFSGAPTKACTDMFAPALQRVEGGSNTKNRSNNNDDKLKLSAERVYAAWLGYYKAKCGKLRMTPAQLVELANELSASVGLDQPPALQKRTIGKMGLKGIPGIRIDHDTKY